MSDLGLTNHKGHPGKTLALVTNNEADFINLKFHELSATFP